MQNVAATLTAVGNLKQNEQWLTSDLRVIPKSTFNYLRHLFAKCDLQKSRSLLVAIRVRYIRAKDPRMVNLYNHAVLAFNQLAPKEPLALVFPETLRELNKQCLRPAIPHFADDLLEKGTTCTDDQIKSFLSAIKYESMFAECKDKINQFEKAQGKVILLPQLKQSERYKACLGIEDQTIIPMCHAGLFRSPVIALAARCLKQNNGYDQREVRAQHGTRYGVDSRNRIDEHAHAGEFERAFGIERGKRFGYDILEEFTRPRGRFEKPPVYIELGAAFDNAFYGFSGTNWSHPKVFVVFGEAGFSVLDRLLIVNKDRWCLQSITVVMIPEDDWIAPAKIHHAHSEIQGLNPTHSISELPDEKRRELFWALTSPEPFPETLRPYMDFYKDTTITAEAWRTAYWKWSGLFQPIARNHADPFIKRMTTLAENIKQTTRAEILQLREWFFKEEASNHVLAYNMVAKAFNRTFTGQPLLETVISPELRAFNTRYIAHPVASFPEDLMQNKEPASEEHLKILCNLMHTHWDIYIKPIRQFEECGGKVILIPPVNHYEDCFTPSIGITKEMYVKPVCHMGQVRSQALAQIALEVKRRLGCQFGEENVALPHGVKNGYDPASWSHSSGWGPDSEFEHIHLFPAAFGIHRQDRFGKKEWNEKRYTAETFQKLYFQDKHNEVVYLAAASAGFDLISDLMRANLEYKDYKIVPEPGKLKNITVVILPEGDWITNNYVYPQYIEILLELINKANDTKAYLEPFKQLSEEEEMHMFWIMNGKRPLEEKDSSEIIIPYVLKHFAGKRHTITDHGLRQHFEVVAYQLAYRRWTGLFVPITE